MDDAMSKIGELLSDEESVKQLSELAQMFMGEMNGEGEASADGGLDFTKLAGIMGAVSGSDKNTELLLALKPHLTERRQERIDKAIKLLKLLAVWDVLKDSGMLGELI